MALHWRDADPRPLVRRSFDPVDPVPRLLASRVPITSACGVMACVYRPERGAIALQLVEEALAAGLTPVLWALTAIDARLEPWTHGVGPGTRQQLLNHLSVDASGTWIVLADDDVVVPAGGLAQLLATADRTDLQVVQPAHSPRSYASTRFVRPCPGVLVRRTGFVELGPLVALRGGARDDLLPLDESLGMGWGQDYLWARRIADRELPVGIIDGIRMRHLSPAGTTYDLADAHANLRSCMAQSGYTSFRDPQRTFDRWWCWQREFRRG